VIRRLLRDCGPDDGITLIEMVVAMTLMAIFMSMFSAALFQVYDTVKRSDSTTVVQSQINVAFLHLDRDIRYASALTPPGPGSGANTADSYVEYMTVGASTTCTQLRLHLSGGLPGTLQSRTWTLGNTPGSTWSILASGVTATPNTTVFTVSNADAVSNFERLEVVLTTQSGTGTSQASRPTDITFTALNSRPVLDRTTNTLTPPDGSGCVLGR